MLDLRSVRIVFIFHTLFAAVCLIVLTLPVGVKPGARLLALVVLYNLALPLTARLLGLADWWTIWKVVFPISLCQVFPDWFLSTVLGTLVFPADDGVFHIGSVAGYMAGLWAIPLFLIVFVAEQVEARLGRLLAYLTAGLSALIVFGIAEQYSPLLGSWYAKEVRMLGHIALYVLVPEMILGAAAYFVYRRARSPAALPIFWAAPAVALLYTGALAISYLLFERLSG